jgi:hypothetical protein
MRRSRLAGKQVLGGRSEDIELGAVGECMVGWRDEDLPSDALRLASYLGCVEVCYFVR